VSDVDFLVTEVTVSAEHRHKTPATVGSSHLTGVASSRPLAIL